jgi:4-carboxymuconolactone decarboxylase
VRLLRIRASGRAPNEGEIFEGGRVLTQSVIDESLSDRHRILEVSFTAGARTKLHEHDTDQVLVITEGSGIVGTRGERFDVVPGDVVFIPAREAHFHGARPGASMTHFSILGPGETRIIAT